MKGIGLDSSKVVAMFSLAGANASDDREKGLMPVERQEIIVMKRSMRPKRPAT
jgi:hypothetical protein